MLSFRPATIADLPAMVDLLADDPLGQTREAPGSPAYATAFAAIAADPNQLQAVADFDGAVIGMLQLSFIPGLARQGAWRGQIEAVRVAAAHRRGGVGQAMFEWAIEQCRARGCAFVQLTTDKARPDAHRFYERLGFEPSHIGYKLAL